MEENFSQRFEMIYEKYKSLVADLGCKPSELAFSRYIEVVQATMQNWKKGQIPGPKDLKKIHDKLGFAYDWLISGQGEMFDNTAQRLAEQERQIQELSARLCGNESAAKASASNTAHAVGQE